MKKQLYSTLLAAACVAAFSSCESDIDNYMVDDTVGLLNAGLYQTEVYEGLTDPTYVYVLKSGKGFQSASVSIKVDEAAIEEYNETAKVPVAALPAECYSLTVTSLDLTNDVYRAPFVLTWNREALAAALAEDPNLVVPLRMTCNSEGINIDEDRLTTFVKPSLVTPKIYLESTGLATGLTPTRASVLHEDIFVKVSSTFICQKDLDFTVAIDEQALNEYNEAHGTDYVMLPADAYEIESDWTIKEYLSSTMFKFRFLRNAIIPEDGPSKFGEYVLPIRLKSCSYSTIDPEKDLLLYRVSVVAAPLAKDKWTIESSYGVEDEEIADPETLLDNVTTTFWRSTSKDASVMPYTFTIDLGADRDLFKMGWQAPSGSNKKYNNSKAGYVEASSDGETWTKIADWTCPNKNTLATEFAVTPTNARYVRLVITETFDGTPATAISEINAWGE